MILFGNVLKKSLTLIPFEQHSVHQAGRLRKKQKRKLFLGFQIRVFKDS